jgi:hypothetical protein
MSDMRMHAHDGAEGAGDATGAAALAMFLWVVVSVALAYGLYNTVIKVADLFSGWARLTVVR